MAFFSETSSSYSAVRKTKILIQVLVNKGDQGGENGVQTHREDDGPMYCAFDEAKGERPSGRKDQLPWFWKETLGRDAFTVEVYGDYSSQTESYFSFGDFSTTRPRYRCAYQPLGMLKQSNHLSMVCATGSRNKRDIFYSRFSSNVVNDYFCCAFLNPDLS